MKLYFEFSVTAIEKSANKIWLLQAQVFVWISSPHKKLNISAGSVNVKYVHVWNFFFF